MDFVFTEQQEKTIQEGVEWFKNSSEQTFEICGEAGTGKSVVLHEIIRRLELNRFQYMPMAYTGQAAIIMRQKGFVDARSIHSSLYKCIEVEVEDSDESNYETSTYNRPKKKRIFVLKAPYEIDEDVELFVIDEGYMVGKKMRDCIESFGRKILVAGDDGQLPPVKDEPAYFTGYGVHRLTQLMRQAEGSPIIYIAQRARRGLPIHCGVYGNNVLVIEDRFIDPQLLKISQCVICGTNRTRDMLNDHIRRDLYGITSDLPVHNERLICRNNNWEEEIDNISLANGLIGTVVNQPDVFGYDGTTFTIDFVPDLFPVVFPDIKVNYKYYKAKYEDRKKMDYDKHFIGNKFEFAYANTAYVTQGSEFHTGMYIEEFLRANVQNQLNYTGVTRFKNNLIYVKKSKNFSTYISI